MNKHFFLKIGGDEQKRRYKSYLLKSFNYRQKQYFNIYKHLKKSPFSGKHYETTNNEKTH